jgi:predicted polyphosphate/ATP-dependent NAD kinase
MRRVGFVLNPIAGMGGRVGLKGTDGKVEAAIERGAEPSAPERGLAALDALAASGTPVDLLTYGEPMGESVARDAGFGPAVVGGPATGAAGSQGAEDADDRDTHSDRVAGDDSHGGPEQHSAAGTRDDADTGTGSRLFGTSAEDTQEAVTEFVDRGVDLVLFVGGDGTAVDVAETLDRLESDVPILGVPAGVKVYSSVFAVRPRAAGRIAATFEGTETGEVNDIDEDEYREGEVTTELRAIVRTPTAEERQAGKQLGGGTVETLATGFAEDVTAGRTYVLGPGSTVGAITEALGFAGSPLGVDVWRDGEVLVRDGGASEIEAALGDDNMVVVSPIGGQGFVFGRGNQQISPAVIRAAEVEVVASRSKLDDIDVLRVDTGDGALDEALRGWIRVRVGRFERRLARVE